MRFDYQNLPQKHDFDHKHQPRPHFKLKFDTQTPTKPKDNNLLKLLFTKRHFRNNHRHKIIIYKKKYRVYYHDHYLHKP